MLYHDHAHNLVGYTSCSDALACNAKTYKQIYLSMAGKGLIIEMYLLGTFSRIDSLVLLNFLHLVCKSQELQPQHPQCLLGTSKFSMILDLTKFSYVRKITIEPGISVRTEYMFILF